MGLPETGQAASLSIIRTNWQLLILVSGPGGVGKGTIVTELRRLMPNLQLCPSAVTRPHDDRDAEGEYIYLDIDAFAKEWRCGRLLEADPHMGNWYGLTHPGEDVLAISDIDVKGSLRMYEAGFPNVLRIGVLPPGDTIEEMIEVCVQRMVARGSDANTIQKRRDRAVLEIRLIHNEWHRDPDAFVVVNDDLHRAVAECHQRIMHTPRR